MGPCPLPESLPKSPKTGDFLYSFFVIKEISKDREFMISFGNLSQCLVTLTIKERHCSFLMTGTHSSEVSLAKLYFSEMNDKGQIYIIYTAGLPTVVTFGLTSVCYMPLSLCCCS